MNTNAHPDSTIPWPYRESLYADESDRKRHAGSMRAVANDVERPVDEIAQVYESVLEHLKTQARIEDYLPILVSKKVREFYRGH
jgi:hypothetical protein